MPITYGEASARRAHLQAACHYAVAFIEAMRQGGARRQTIEPIIDTTLRAVRDGLLQFEADSAGYDLHVDLGPLAPWVHGAKVCQLDLVAHIRRALERQP